MKLSIRAAAYRLILPPSRHDLLKEFRVLVLDSHPLLPVATEIRAALDQLENRLAAVARSSSLLPDLAESARLHTCESAWGPGADRHGKPLTSLIWAGSFHGADPQSRCAIRSSRLRSARFTAAWDNSQRVQVWRRPLCRQSQIFAPHGIRVRRSPAESVAPADGSRRSPPTPGALEHRFSRCVRAARPTFRQAGVAPQNHRHAGRVPVEAPSPCARVA